jgi:endonuclease/exonuclease/phosphatase family metal-dependent hydrolase
MTYNVHSCIGMDGRISPHRIARVIARHDPDIVALQEVDVRRFRTGGLDQVETLAKILKMDFHFQPALQIEEEQYGDAVLSRYPMKLIHSACLPSLSGAAPLREPRGALWVEIDVDGHKIQLINTHLSLWRKERLLQTNTLLGPEWLGNPIWKEPAILCGDFNAVPGSTVCRLLDKQLFDAQGKLNTRRASNTYFGRYPFGRIDHIYVGKQVKVLYADVPKTELEKISSDHLPLIVDFKFIA